MPTPLKPILKSLPSSAKLPQTDDYVKERQEAMTRLFSVWSSLAEKYSKPLEEDDIVDVLTGEVVKDRGVISSWDRSQQGLFVGGGRSRKSSETREEKEETKEQANEEEAEETNEEPPEGEEEEFDELDSFATEVGCDFLHAKEVKESKDHSDIDDISVIQPMPLANFFNFRDDENLKEFMEAEKRRKELYGDDDSSDSDLEQLQAELRHFRRRSSYVTPIENEDEVPYPPPSSSPLPPSSPIRASSPTVPPPSPSVGTSSSSARVSLSPLRAFSSFKSPSHSSARACPSSSSSSRVPPPSSTSVSSSFFRAPPSSARKHSSFRASPWLSSSPVLSTLPSFRASSSVRVSSPDLFTSSSTASSSSMRLSTPSLPPSSSSSIRWASPSSSSFRSSLPPAPPSPLVRSSSCFIPLDSESEDELLSVWTQPEEKVSKKSSKSKLPSAIRETPSKTPGPKLKRISKRKRVVTSSEEESSSTHSLSEISFSTRAKSLSPKKRIVDEEILYSACDDTQKDEGALRKSTLRPQKHIISNG